MLKFLVKALGLIAGLALSGAVCAMGMGGINVTTALGEPLNAEIELVAIGKAEKDKLSARLASPDAFKGAGMEYPSGLPALKFQIEAHADGAPYLKVTSTQPVNEPFISLLVELNWPSGRLLREYTFLLDPPSYKPEQPKAAEVKPVLPSKVEPSAAERPYQHEWAEAAKSESAPMRAKVPMDEKAPAEAAAPAKKPAGGGNVTAGSIKVKRGDTLSQVARETKTSDVSLERMLVALYRANINAFDGKNMNRLSTGKILRIPEQSELGGLAQDDAVKEIRTQVADWNAYRQKLAAASVHAAEQAPRQTASGKISTTVAEKAPVVKETAKEVVRLSKGEAPGDKTATGGSTKNLQDKIHALEEEAIAKSKALKESNERVAMLEKNIKEMQRLIELKGLAVAPKPEAKPEPAKVAPKPPVPLPPSPVASSGTSATSTVVAQAASAVKPSKPARPVIMEPKMAPPPPSLLDEPLYLAGGAAALLALGGLGFVAIRRRKGGKPNKKAKASDGSKGEEDTGSIAHISEPVMPSPETGDFTHISAIPGSAQPEDVDPISEAELFLNFGRDAQAEEILKDALDKNPANNRIRLKLLSIYAKRKDSKTFSAIARQIQDSGDEPAWAQAAEMGRGLEPNNPRYGSTGDETITVVATEEQGKGEQQAAASLDFDLGLAPEATAATNDENAELGASFDQKGAAIPAMDFDLGIGEPAAAAPENESTMILSAPLLDQTAAAPLAMDFDLGIGEPEEAVAPVDEGATTLSAPQAEQMPAEELQTVHEAPMDFDITTKHPSVAAAEPEPVAAAITPNLDDLVFDITSSHPSTDAAKEEITATDAPEDTDNAMEFTLDFPVEEKPDTAATQAAPKETVDIDLSGISFDLDESTAAAPASDVKDAHWHDVATKLDLAKAYQEMGDNAGAREILDEVLAEGDEQQRATAEAMKQQLLD